MTVFSFLINKIWKPVTDLFHIFHSALFSLQWSRKKTVTQILPIQNSLASQATDAYKEQQTSTSTAMQKRKAAAAANGQSREEVEVSLGVVVEKMVEVRQIKHYSSHHRILLVGEGDFSFAASLALAFRRAPNMIATSLNSEEFLKENYAKAASYIADLRRRKCTVLHEIDATQLSTYFCINFDRIVWNFPYAGFFKNLPRDAELRRHRRLVSLFLKNAKEMITKNGEIHITHMTKGSFYRDWNLESIASSHGLKLIEAVKFSKRNYPGYRTKYGFGGDKDFECNPSKTFKFGLK